MIGVGIELGASAIKVAVVEQTRTGFALRGFDVVKTDAKKGEAEDDIVSTLADCLKRLKAPTSPVVASVRAADCTIRELAVPFTDLEKIRKTIKYQAESFFTSHSIDDLIIEFSRWSETEGKSKLLVAGIKKAQVERRLALLGECGIDPSAVDLDVAAAFNTFAHIGAFEGKGAGLIVDVEADTLKIGVVEDGKLRLARAVRMQVGSMRIQPGKKPKPGADESGVHETAADDSARLPVVILDEGEDEAMFSLEDSGISETEREGILHRVFMEIDRTVAACALAKEVELIILTGASCALEGIEATFTEHFEIEARRVDVSEALGKPKDDMAKGGRSVSLEGATAIGLALKGLGVDHAGMDFRQEEFAYQGTFAQLKRGVACTLTLLFALTFLYAFTLKQELREKKGAYSAAKELQKNLYTVLFPSLDQLEQDHLDLKAGKNEDQRYLDSLQSERLRMQRKFGGASSGDQGTPRYSALEILRQFSIGKAKLDKQWGIEVLRIRVDPRDTGKSTFDCVSHADQAAYALSDGFKDNAIVTASVQQNQRDPKTGKFLFTLVVQVKPAGGPRG